MTAENCTIFPFVWVRPLLFKEESRVIKSRAPNVSDEDVATLVQLAQIGLQFNEAKSDNPFAYYTATVNNSFTRVLNLEKRNQTIRDDILIEQGHLPSYGRQIQHENELKAMRDSAEAEVDAGSPKE